MQQTGLMQSLLNAGNQDAANLAFDEWLRLADQAHWVDATVLPLVAAVLILLVWRAQPLSASECGLIIVGFTALMTWRVGVIYADRKLAVSVLLFAVTLAGQSAWNTIRRIREGAA